MFQLHQGDRCGVFFVFGQLMSLQGSPWGDDHRLMYIGEIDSIAVGLHLFKTGLVNGATAGCGSIRYCIV